MLKWTWQLFLSTALFAGGLGFTAVTAEILGAETAVKPVVKSGWVLAERGLAVSSVLVVIGMIHESCQ